MVPDEISQPVLSFAYKAENSVKVSTMCSLLQLLYTILLSAERLNYNNLDT